MRKTLKDYYKDIQKCSKCGLCMSVCPVYDITKNDCSVARGKFIMLYSILNGKTEYNKTCEKYLDMCLKCNKCKDYCPTNINTKDIILKAKEEIFEQKKKTFFNKSAIFLLETALKITKIFTDTYRFLHIGKIINLILPVLSKTKYGRKIIALNEILTPTHLPDIKHKNKKEKLKVVYFKGCYDKYITPNTKKSVEYLLKKLDIELISADFKCCGMSFLHEGDIENFLKLAEHNISQIPDDFDCFITDCETCQNTFKYYEKYIEDEKLLNKIKNINSKSHSALDFIIKNFKEFKFKKEVSFTYHKPCNTENIEFLSEFIKKCPKAIYVKSEKFDDCCGFSGLFSLKEPEISKKILRKKTENLLNANTDYILTNCSLCQAGLTLGICENSNKNKKICNFIEFIAENLEEL